MTSTGREFERFANVEAGDSSPLYNALAHCVADDEDLLAIADATPPGQPAPNLLLAAVQFLLFDHRNSPLAAYFASMTDFPRPPDEDLTEHFREFSLTNRDEILDVISTRRVQTNLVRRSAILLPVFEYLSRRSGRSPLGLVDIGTSAGLNLLWDKYRYEFTGRGTYGPAESSVQIPCGVLGSSDLPLPEEMPPIGSRLGIDLDPLDVREEDDARWLRALVWPELEERRSLTEAAISVARDHPPQLIRGDVLDVLLSTCERVPLDEQLCIVNTHTLYQLSPDEQVELETLIEQVGETRELFWIWAEPTDGESAVRLTTFANGTSSTQELATHDLHGRWIEWQARG